MRIGQIVGTHGLKGQFKVQPLTDFMSRFQKGAEVSLKGKAYVVETCSTHKGRPLMKLVGIDDISVAEKLQWEFLEAPDDRPELADDEFLVEDLIGLMAYDENGVELGEVDEVLDSPAHEILVIGEIMVPFIEEFILEIDFDAETIKLSLLPGMRPGEETA
jgi:16S rRNA processing protein RimM